jgi:hypothetical protein
MSDAVQVPAARKRPAWAVPLIACGAALVLLSSGGLLLLRTLPGDPAPVSGGGKTPVPTRQGVLAPTPTPPVQARVERRVLAPPSPTLTPMPTPTATRPPSPPIPWTEGEKNALTWLCWHEVRGMQEVRVDACLSVISTVRARYAYSNGFPETDVVGTLLRPGQFNIEFDTGQPAPDPELYWIVEQYQYGLRGSCNGYLYFDSVPGGPSLCVIRSGNNQFMEFHNGWN